MRVGPLVFGLLLSLAVPAVAEAYERAPRTAAFRSFVSTLRRAAAERDVAAVARLANKEFTIGEERDRAASLGALRERPDQLATLVRLLDHGTCYRTQLRLVQCELPDPGPQLDHTRAGGRSAFLIAERTQQGWRMNVFAAP